MSTTKELLDQGILSMLLVYERQGKTYETSILEDGTKRIFIDKNNEILIFPTTPSEYSVYFSNQSQCDKIYPYDDLNHVYGFNRKAMD